MVTETGLYPSHLLINSAKKRVHFPKKHNLSWSSVNVSNPKNKTPTWMEKLTFSTNPKKEQKILHNVSGIAESGRLLAIMGSSGAGKTTLLNVLTFRNLANLDVQGSVMLDGQHVSKWKLREISAFVQQHDMFVGTLTVREHLQFMARLRMGSIHTQCERELRVEEVIQKMGLMACADTVIAIEGVKGLSCGEKKRLSFASEILTSPKILFCDEPTSGLDAFMAGQVVSALNDLAQSGMTVITTIHQPSSQVFSHFHECGYPCPAFFNPADHFIRTLAVIDSKRNTSLKTIGKIRDEFLKTAQGKAVLKIASVNMDPYQNGADFKVGSDKNFFNQEYAASFCAQFMALFWRSWLTVARDPMLLKSRVAQIVVTALITGFVYFNTQVSPETIISINGIMFNHIRNINFMLQFPNVPVITSELPIVQRENANGVYSTSAYFIAKNLAELPQFTVLPIVYSLIVYWMSGLYPAVLPFLFSCLIAVLVINVAISISYAVAIIFVDLPIAMAALPTLVVPLMAFGGFYITFDAIPSYFSWLSTLSYFKYGYEAFAINQWENIDYIPGCQNASSSQSFCPSTGSAVLEDIDFSPANKWRDVLILSMMIVVIRLIAYIAFLVRSYLNQ